MELATDKFLALVSQKVAMLVDDENFLAWKQHVMLIVKIHRLQMFLEGAVFIPPKIIVNEEGCFRRESFVQPTLNEIDSTQHGQSSHFHMPAVIGQTSGGSSISGSD
ncbi:hypothetical protein J1N35_027787 [Gossypium stocksii]|uniref:Retrotransposon Copia-like N-terminal domain-containing protein n=1 Tax=Gossypium stocksii TaxID=47602 RepID=A0A9D3VB00_9ROSI|nr:hypothetical protein J1N35_027787 [Gossypium stocksii]